MRGMVIDMNDEQLSTLRQLRAFVEGTVTIDFTVATAERYAAIARTVKRFGYGRLKRAEKAVVLRFLERVAATRDNRSPDRSSAAVSAASSSSATMAPHQLSTHLHGR